MIRPVQFFATVCVLASALDVTTAVCCPNEVMKLQTEASNVERLLWASVTSEDLRPSLSAVSRDFRESGCADGRHVGSLDVCSVGPCNFFHCNCDGGCITGRQFDVPTIGEQPLSFYCDKDVPADLDKDVMNLIKHRDCTCSNAVHRDLRHTSGDYTLSVTEVEGPEQNASDPIYCEKGMVYCEVDIRRVKSFGVTTSLSFTLGAGAGLSLKKIAIPVDFSATHTTEWSETTATETGFHCTAQGGGVTWLRIKPKYYKLTVATVIPRLQNRRNYCEIRHVYVPRTNADGTIAGDRRCVYRNIDE